MAFNCETSNSVTATVVSSSCNSPTIAPKQLRGILLGSPNDVFAIYSDY